MIDEIPNCLPPAVDYFSLRELPAESEKYEPHNSVLYYKGRDTGIVLNGTFFRAQFSVGNRFLLFIEDMAMHEESLFIYLVDAKLNILDKIGFCWLTVSACLADLSVVSNNEFEFDTLGGPWRLRIYDAPRFYFPYAWGLNGIWRKVTWKTYFSLSKVKN